LAYKKLAKSKTLNLTRVALKSYYQDFCNRKLFSKIKATKIENNLPKVLSKAEIQRMISITENKKHKLLIELIYASGSRINISF